MTPGSLWRRSGLSTATVLETYPGLRIGNYLYFALHAHQRRSGRSRLRILDSGLDGAWLEAFPRLVDLMATPLQARWWPRNSIPPSFLQEFGAHFTGAALDEFVGSVLIASSALAEAVEDDVPDLVVNVRRGDYTEPEFINLYGFDIADYVRRATTEAGEAWR